MTLITRFGKHRSQSQRRFILVQHHDRSGRIVTIKRSDDPRKLHKFATSSRGGFRWSLDQGCWIDRCGEHVYRAVVIDTQDGTEVPR